VDKNSRVMTSPITHSDLSGADFPLGASISTPYPPRFTQCLQFVLTHEGGGRVNRDSGGVTKWGISQRAYPELDIVSLTLEDVTEIYFRDYFSPNLSCPIDLLYFDSAVNCGKVRAGKWLQASINGYLPRNYIEIDGVIGTLTIEALKYCPQDLLTLSLLNVRLLYYYSLRKTHAEYFSGWIGRVADLIGVLSEGCYDASLIKSTQGSL